MWEEAVEGRNIGLVAGIRGGGGSGVPNVEDTRGGGERVDWRVAARGRVVEVEDGVVPEVREPAWLRLARMGDGDRQLPKTASCSMISLNADAVGEGLEYSDIDGRPPVGIDSVMDGRTCDSSSISSMGVTYERSSSSENRGDARKRLLVEGRVDNVSGSRGMMFGKGDTTDRRCSIDSDGLSTGLMVSSETADNLGEDIALRSVEMVSLGREPSISMLADLCKSFADAEC